MQAVHGLAESRAKHVGSTLPCHVRHLNLAQWCTFKVAGLWTQAQMQFHSKVQQEKSAYRWLNSKG